ncbi:hypothetical protein CALVIDRAFT_232993 [Calocera viscosa TUFC12733]|uniref:Uncharacterized protein n=1 Tax=Calocera viscosa (strain TUFC12733) TaxID=1330018 RepID=A0A167JYF1_CALVF|nr:hypothetical protein CALVIDRAFT_232993 [Calocera viscosa TUFC12733]
MSANRHVSRMEPSAAHPRLGQSRHLADKHAAAAAAARAVFVLCSRDGPGRHDVAGGSGREAVWECHIPAVRLAVTRVRGGGPGRHADGRGGGTPGCIGRRRGRSRTFTPPDRNAGGGRSVFMSDLSFTFEGVRKLFDGKNVGVPLVW